MKTIEEKIREYIEEKNVTEDQLKRNPYVKSAESTSLATKSSSGYGKAPWNETELIDKINKCVIMLDHYNHNLNPTNIDKLLGLPKNSEYFTEDGEKYFVKSLSKQIIENYLQTPEQRQDPHSVEHTPHTICSINMGSGTSFEDLNLSTNQQLFAVMLLPVFSDEAILPIVISIDPFSQHDGMSSSKLMALILQMALSKHDWFHHAMSSGKVTTYCEHLNGCIKAIVATDRIHSKNGHLEYLFKQDRQFAFTQLFERYGRYINGIQSYKYRLTPLMHEVLNDAIHIFIELDLALSSLAVKESDLIVTKDMLKQINPRDLFILLNYLTGVDEGGNYIIQNTIMDRQDSRVYSLMTSIKSETREKLGFINYDISACMQTITAHFVDMDSYPQHQALINHKRTFRQNLADDLDIDMDAVKEILAAADNGSRHKARCENSETLKAYIIEADSMVDEFLDNIEKQNPDLIQNASSYAKHEMNIVRWEKKIGYIKEQPVFERGELKKYSVFFFVWTQIEREIRHAMMSCFKGFVHEVHDAVYSKEVIPLKVLEQAVLEQTGIEVKIEH